MQYPASIEFGINLGLKAEVSNKITNERRIRYIRDMKVRNVIQLVLSFLLSVLLLFFNMPRLPQNVD
jgi:hypothetical protein